MIITITTNNNRYQNIIIMISINIHDKYDSVSNYSMIIVTMSSIK